ncbi:MAG: mannose-1-phosphate guanylyltransferase [Planctomycetota bacterium]|nr:MAG: mannose-1-phosphate guanylyltransferase [Planctomycetota bacterium]
MSHKAPYAVIMAGGSGTRFWPLSRAANPKQLLNILNDTTMIQATVARLQPYIPAERVLVITTEQLAAETRRQLPMLPPEHIVAEPVGRDTAACVCLAALLVERLDSEATMILLPADQVIGPADRFQRALQVGVETAHGGGLVTYGITPRFASTGYGYVKVAEELHRSEDGVSVRKVDRFVEKPDAATAQSYVDSGDYRWNSGIFTWRADVVLSALSQHTPWLVKALAPVADSWGSDAFAAALAEAYEPLKKISVDYALLEQADDIKVVTGDFDWDDVGSWDALYDHLPADEAGVIHQGETLAIDCRDSLLLSRSGQTIAAIGLEGLTVVATADAILVCPKGQSQEVKAIVDRLKASGPQNLL